jgi:hypothetical protein
VQLYGEHQHQQRRDHEYRQRDARDRQCHRHAVPEVLRRQAAFRPIGMPTSSATAIALRPTLTSTGNPAAMI